MMHRPLPVGQGQLGEERLHEHGTVKQTSRTDTEHVRVLCLYGHNGLWTHGALVRNDKIR